MKFTKKRIILELKYPKRNIPILKGQIKHKNAILNIMMGLALNGSSNTWNLTEFALLNDKTDGFRSINSHDKQSMSKTIRENINKGQIKKSGKRKTGRYPGLIQEKYVINIGTKINKKNKYVPHYFLTLKGCFFVLGFNLDNEDLDEFIKNASANHLLFAYINTILLKTSITFVKEIFITPIQKLIKNGKIYLDEDLEMFITLVSEACGRSLYTKYDKIVEVFAINNSKNNFSVKLDKHQHVMNIETLIDNTFYYEKQREDWSTAILEKYYKNEKQREFYHYNSDKFEISLLYHMMRQIHFAYYDVLGQGIPRNPRKHLRSKEFKKYMKEKRKTLKENNIIDETMKLRGLDESDLTQQLEIQRELQQLGKI